MNWVRSYITTITGPMIPSEPTSKRKMPDDANPLANASKRLKKESSVKPGAAAKRKLLNGEEQPGGLVIVRAPPSRPPSTQPPDQHPVRPPSTEPRRHPSATPGPSQPASKKFRSDSRPATGHRPVGKAKDRDLVATSRPDPEVDEDVRLMNDEAEHLRRRSRANADHVNPDFNFPAVAASAKQPPPSSRNVEQTRQGRALTRNGDTQQHGRRKSSLSMRGKRVSTTYETSGVITQPHASVSDSSFYKHIDADLPEAQRARQLLIWCSSRAMNRNSSSSRPSSSSGSKPKSGDPGKDPPANLRPLSAEAAKVLKAVQEDVVRMLAEKKIDTNVYGPTGMLNDMSAKKMKPNEQNIKNRAREIRFTEHIERARAEDEAWDEVVHFYNGHQSRVLAALDERRRSRAQSAKAKGKQRAVDDYEPRESELSDVFRGPNGVELARKVLAEVGGQDPLSARLHDLEFTIDRLQALVQTSMHTTHYAEDDLNHRFALLSLSLSARSEPLSSLNSAKPGSLSSFLPPSLSHSPSSDARDIFRALSRVDAERPPAQVGDAARRAVREVQRVNEAGGGIPDRRLTGVLPPTPRKPPGTPRRATTPGRGR
ncbi:hypothetical protein GLOTRDRAFT_140210 [Gloeophyllum trabeum ATCC 11539]|uniref:Mis12-Mtw1 protein family n=1 Tax=Gloeophyllum trabeum (strain ATCC 11539 / FP-39264 / Madison 617) TaxID=670483 RepID=S7PYT6_GLOTA|nr:uncharacterized protein GLOTRDRAFT_140210 [Gloeophyllum trabeum ATCC 11539]EPQ52472.1 hypothetical protein GLOTRDRAFT_140210 [Gloeophyllum trabeum ATCC 11539]